MAVLRFAGATAAAAAVLAIFLAAALPQLRTAQHRSRQKKTMSAMRTAAIALEQGKVVPPFEDAWGTPVRIRVRRPHVSLRSAGADRKFETSDARGITNAIKERGADIVLIDEAFVQFPDGVSYVDEPGVTPDPTTRPCASCHPTARPATP